MSTEDVEQGIAQAASDGSVEAKVGLFRRLRLVEVLFPTAARYLDGEVVNTTPLRRLPDGSHAMMLYASKTHPDLGEDFSGASLETALRLALTMPDADWVILSTLASQWVALDRTQMAAALDGPVQDAASGDRLAALISQAAATSPQRFTEALLAELTGRELYVDLAAQRSPQEQPMVATYTVGGLAGVVRAFVSRRRHGVRYGGMPWEALRDMVRAAPALGGVQVVNDAEDWVLFDRPVLDPPVTYYAKLRDGGSPGDPMGIVRRTHGAPPVDEAFGRDMRWHPTEFLRRAESLGTSDVDHVQISRDAAEAVLERWRSQWSAEP